MDRPPVPAPTTPRLPWLDAARGVALLGMILYHTVFDLELFGHLPRGTSLEVPWRPLAVAVAGGFIFLAGVSLVLAHGAGIRWRAFGRRFLKIAAAAALVSAATYLSDPGSFIFFGILHAIAAFSLLGLAALRLPVVGLLALAAGFATLGPVLTHPGFDHPALLWTGLSPRTPLTLDFEPLFPWAAPFLLGMAAGRALPARLRRETRARGAASRALQWAGQRSLAIYLLHQPVLIALIGGITYLAR